MFLVDYFQKQYYEYLKSKPNRTFNESFHLNLIEGKEKYVSDKEEKEAAIRMAKEIAKQIEKELKRI